MMETVGRKTFGTRSPQCFSCPVSVRKKSDKKADYFPHLNMDLSVLKHFAGLSHCLFVWF